MIAARKNTLKYGFTEYGNFIPSTPITVIHWVHGEGLSGHTIKLFPNWCLAGINIFNKIKLQALKVPSL